MEDSLEIGDVRANPGQRARGWLTVADLPGSKVQIPFSILNGAEDGPVVFLNSGSHGAEYCSIQANIEIQRTFDPSKLKGAIISSLITNIPSFNTRTPFLDPIDFKNVNRCFPGKSNGSMSERIAYAVMNEFIEKADYVFDMHGGDYVEDIGRFNIA